MTSLMTFRRARYACWILIAIALGGCVGAHAAKAHSRTIKPAHSAPRSDTAPRPVPEGPETKPLVGELMA